MADRRQTYWMSFSEGATLLTQGPGIQTRLLIPSLRETEVGREYEGYTVIRVILKLWLHSTGAEAVITSGIMTHAEGVALAQLNPANDPHVDWLWQEDTVVSASVDEPRVVERDLRSMRKSRGGDNNLFWYVVNRSGVVSVELHRSGRALIKRA